MDIELDPRFFRPVVVVMLACLLSLALLRILVLMVLEPGEPVRPSLHYRPSSLSKKLIGTLPALRAAYTVPSCWYLMTAHSVRSVLVLVATAAAQACARWTGRVRFLREYLLMEDDGLVSLDWALLGNNIWCQSTSSHHSKWIVILVPGRWICNSNKNLQSICWTLVDQGHQPVIWNRRGEAGTPLTECAGWPANNNSYASDLRQVIQYLSTENPNSPIALVGFSHSASLIISYLGEFGSSSLIHSAIAVSPLWQHPPAGLDWISSICSQGIRPDSVVMADPLHDSDDIAVPLLVIHYDDDPLVPASTIPRELFTLYPQLLLVTCPLGGHCGQLQTIPLADVIAADFFRQVLAFTSWPSSVNSRQQSLRQQGRRSRVGSLTRSQAIRKPRRNQLKNGRPSCNSC